MPPTPRSFLRPARFGLTLAMLVPVLALLPLGRLLRDWVRVTQIADVQAGERSFDWVQWTDFDGQIVAAYVFPRSPAADAGLREGDVFVAIEGQIIFGVEELKRIIEGLPPGTEVGIEVVRGAQTVMLPIRVTRYPTFLYPLSTGLWLFALWSFLIASLLHVIGLAIALPLARSSLRARFSLGLILVSSLWILSNLGRILLVEFFGPAGVPGSRYDVVFQTLTVLGFVGWLLFPALLISNVLTRAGSGRTRAFRRTAWLRYLPPVLLGLLLIATAARGALGPLTLDVLVGPMLFYAACYIAGASALALLMRRGESTTRGGGWNRWGSLITLVAATLVGLALLGLLPLLGSIEDATLGWLVVLAQLLSVAPITLVALSTLRYGKVGTVVSAALLNGLVAASVFVLFTGTLYALGPILRRTEAPVFLIGGVLCVALLVAAERIKKGLRDSPVFLTSEQQRTRLALRRYGRSLNAQIDVASLAQATVAVAGQTVGASSAVLFYRLPDDDWRSAAYHPAPPHLTAQAVRRLWPSLDTQRELWTRDAELSDVRLPGSLERELRSVGAAVVLPIQGEEQAVGLLALADKRGRRRVYNLEDLDFLRILCGQFGLAVERLGLIEREKALAKGQSEAQLVALRAQINPHFLFNALNTIASLIAERPDEAERVVEHLSAIFRQTLQTAEAPFVPLGHEIRLVEHYLAIEQARFGDSLTTVIDVPAGLRDVPIPPFAVQTLVENAVKHGLAPRRGGGRVSIVAREQDGNVEITVTDDGVGLPTAAPSPSPEHTGIGLRNVGERLEHLYGEIGLLTLRSAPGNGTCASVRLPRSQHAGRS